MAAKETTNQSASFSQGRIVAIVLIYAAFAAAWILLSDRLVKVLFSDPGQIIQVSMFKGWFYVGITSLLLYGLLRRWLYSGQSLEQAVPTTNKQLLWSALVLATVIVVFTVVGISISFKQHQDETTTSLQAVANLKTQQIVDWLKERRGDAEFVQTSVFFAEHYRQWQTSGDQASGEQLQQRLQQLCKNWRLDGVSLIDANGLLIWHSDQLLGKLQPELLKTVAMVREDGDIHQTEPYRDETGRVLLDFVAPLTALNKPLPAPMIVLHIDLANWLFPSLANWPMVSTSGEILLMRRDGDHVRYLNDLRHRPDSAVKLRVPLSMSNLLASQVILGKVEPGKRIEGVDYRNIPALGVANPVDGVSWFLIAKLDLAEIYARALDDMLWVGLVGVLALFVVGVGYYLLRQMQRLNLVQTIQQTQAERLRALGLLAAIADSSDDAIFAKDLNGRYILFNRAASAFTGKTPEEALGQDDTALFPKEQAEMLLAIDRRVMAKDQVISEEETLNTVAGERVFHATKGPLHDDKGNVSGIFGISRDITNRRAIVSALSRQSEELLSRNQELERFNHAMVGRELEMIKLKGLVNELCLALGREAPYNLNFVDEQNLPDEEA